MAEPAAPIRVTRYCVSLKTLPTHGLQCSRGDLPERKPVLPAPLSFLPYRMDPDHCEPGNSPLDCFQPLRFAGQLRRISFPGGNDIHLADTASGSLLPGKSQDHILPALCPFSVLHTESPAAFVSSTYTAYVLRVVRQVSHCGKPQCTAPSEKPFRLSRFR